MLLTTLTALTLGNAPVLHEPGRTAFAGPRPGGGPVVELWTNRERPLRDGQSVRVYFRASHNSYVTVFRVDTDGGIEVLFPARPWDNNYARGGRRYEVRRGGERHSFVADEYPGQGYLFAVASNHPFDFGPFANGEVWDYHAMGHDGRVVGDPYAALMDIIDVIVPAEYVNYGYDAVPYDVERRYDYPRFLCYDCHAYAAYDVWNPYEDPCYEFRIIVYNDPHYYPARAYVGTRVVFSRPQRLDPRYVFVARDGGDRNITERDRRDPRPSDGARRPAPEGVTGRDVGGIGRIPTPVGRPRRLTDDRVGAVDDLDAGLGRSALDRRIVSELRRRDRSATRNETRTPTRLDRPASRRPQVDRRPPRRPSDSASSRRRPRPDTTAVRESRP